MNQLSPEARALLDAASGADDPTSVDRDRIARALSVPLGIAALAPATAQAGGIAAASTTGLVALKTAVAALTLVALGAGAVLLRSPAPPPAQAQRAAATAVVSRPVLSPRSAPSVAVPPSAVPTVAAPTVAVVAPAGTPTPNARASTGSFHTTTRSVDSLHEENALLREAHAAMSDDPSRALALLDSYGERFPRGVLREERDVERILVLCQLGRLDAARAATRVFMRARPRSPLGPRVQSACGRSAPLDSH